MWCSDPVRLSICTVLKEPKHCHYEVTWILFKIQQRPKFLYWEILLNTHTQGMMSPQRCTKYIRHKISLQLTKFWIWYKLGCLVCQSLLNLRYKCKCVISTKNIRICPNARSEWSSDRNMCWLVKPSTPLAGKGMEHQQNTKEFLEITALVVLCPLQLSHGQSWKWSWVLTWHFGGTAASIFRVEV
jgi:hypothetical protein